MQFKAMHFFFPEFQKFVEMQYVYKNNGMEENEGGVGFRI